MAKHSRRRASPKLSRNEKWLASYVRERWYRSPLYYELVDAPEDHLETETKRLLKRTVLAVNNIIAATASRREELREEEGPHSQQEPPSKLAQTEATMYTGLKTTRWKPYRVKAKTFGEELKRVKTAIGLSRLLSKYEPGWREQARLEDLGDDMLGPERLLFAHLLRVCNAGAKGDTTSPGQIKWAYRCECLASTPYERPPITIRGLKAKLRKAKEQLEDLCALMHEGNESPALTEELDRLIWERDDLAKQIERPTDDVSRWHLSLQGTGGDLPLFTDEDEEQCRYLKRRLNDLQKQGVELEHKKKSDEAEVVEKEEYHLHEELKSLESRRKEFNEPFQSYRTQLRDFRKVARTIVTRENDLVTIARPVRDWFNRLLEVGRPQYQLLGQNGTAGLAEFMASPDCEFPVLARCAVLLVDSERNPDRFKVQLIKCANKDCPYFTLGQKRNKTVCDRCGRRKR